MHALHGLLFYNIVLEMMRVRNAPKGYNTTPLGRFLFTGLAV